MKTTAIIGFFDVKQYKAGVEPKDRKMKGNDEQITFATTFPANQIPEGLAKYARIYETKDHEQRASVKFKIGAKVRWFNGNAQPVDRPDNASLDRKRFKAVIDYTQLDGNPEEKEACGYWANAIMFEEVSDNPFEGAPLTAVPAAADSRADEGTDAL